MELGSGHFPLTRILIRMGCGGGKLDFFLMIPGIRLQSEDESWGRQIDLRNYLNAVSFGLLLVKWANLFHGEGATNDALHFFFVKFLET